MIMPGDCASSESQKRLLQELALLSSRVKEFPSRELLQARLRAVQKQPRPETQAQVPLRAFMHRQEVTLLTEPNLLQIE
jgi:hypothetical protein